MSNDVRAGRLREATKRIRLVVRDDGILAVPAPDHTDQLHHAAILMREHVAMQDVRSGKIDEWMAYLDVARIASLAGEGVEKNLAAIIGVRFRGRDRDHVLPNESL